MSDKPSGRELEDRVADLERRNGALERRARRAERQVLALKTADELSSQDAWLGAILLAEAYPVAADENDPVSQLWRKLRAWSGWTDEPTISVHPSSESGMWRWTVFGPAELYTGLAGSEGEAWELGRAKVEELAGDDPNG